MEEKLLSCYEAIATASGRMLDAARAANWDALVSAESDCTALISEARDLRNACDCSAAGESRRLSALRKVMADDAEIRALMQPWLSKLDRALTGKPGKPRLGTSGD
jgi:flagellar protein FliT